MMNTEQRFTTNDTNHSLETMASFNADQPLNLTVTNASGGVSVETDDSLQAGDLRIAATHTDGRPFDDQDHHLTVSVEGNTVSVHPDWQFASGVTGIARRIRDQLQHGFRPEDWNLANLKLGPELDFDIVVALPSSIADDSNVRIRTASGDITARGFAAGTSIASASADVHACELRGIVAIHTASGDIRTERITESLEINTASGDIFVSDGDFWLAARSASGDVVVDGAELRNSRITTVSGDVTLDAFFNNSGSYGVETVSGDVHIHAIVPGNDTRATLGFGTLSGSAQVVEAWQKRKRREWDIGEGDDGPSIHVKTVSGDMSARAELDSGVKARTIAMPSREIDAEEDEASNDFDRADFRQEMRDVSRGMKDYYKGMKTYSKEMKHQDRVGSPVAPVPPVPSAPMPVRQASETGNMDSSASSGSTGTSGGEDGAVQATQPVQAPAQFSDGSRDERLAVLEALEKGEIDIDDALARLEGSQRQPR